MKMLSCPPGLHRQCQPQDSQKRGIKIQHADFRPSQPALPYLSAPDDHSTSLSHPFYSSGDHLIDDLLRRLSLIDDGSCFAHQERPRIIHRIIVDVVSQSLKVMFDRDGAFRCKILDFSCAILFPVFDVRIIADTERSALKSLLGEVLRKGG